MNALFANFDALDRIFLLFAFGGGLLFLGRVAMTLLGGGGDGTHGNLDASGSGLGGDAVHLDGGLAGHAGDGAGNTHAADAGAAHAGAAHHDDANNASDASFRLLTMQGLMAFFLMAGLAGLALHRGSALGWIISALGAFLVGLATMVLVAKIFQWALRLQSSGNVSIWQAIGETGTVYLGISGQEPGQVQICIQNHLKVVDAITADQQPIETGERVFVIDVVNDKTLVVRKVVEPPQTI